MVIIYFTILPEYESEAKQYGFSLDTVYHIVAANAGYKIVLAKNDNNVIEFIESEKVEIFFQ